MPRGTMNWVGGARNRLKLKHEKKIQKEFFERKRHSKKVLRANQGDRQENEGKTGISQDLIALQAIVSAHDKPKRKPRGVRQPHAVDLDEAKRKDHSRRKYCVELPESPGHHKSSTLDLSTGIPEPSHAQKKHDNSQSWAKHDICESILKHEALHNVHKRPWLSPKDALPIQTWTNPPVKETPCYKPLPVRKEQPKLCHSSFDQKPVVQEFSNFNISMQKDSGDYYRTPIKQKRTMEGKFLCFDDNEFPETSNIKDNDSPQPRSKLRPLPFVPFSKPGPFSKFNANKPKDQQELENKKFADQTFNSVCNKTTQMSSTCTKTAHTYSYAETKPTMLETPVQTWTARKPNIDRKDSHWSHFQIQAGQPSRKNLFLDKMAQIEVEPPNTESKRDHSLGSKTEDKEKNTEKIDEGAQETKWNPFNLSYPVKVESGGEGDDSKGCGQETAWRTLLKGSNRLSTERLKLFATIQHKDDHVSNLDMHSEEAASQKFSSFELQEAPNSKPIINDRFTPESDMRESLDHEALREVMDLERDDQSSELTSSWSSTITDETEGNRPEFEAFEDHEARVISSKNSVVESDSVEKWQSMESMSSTTKLATLQFEDATLNVPEVKINDNQSKVLSSGRGFNQMAKSPSAFLKCTESIYLFNETEERKAGLEQDLEHGRCTGGYPGKVEDEDSEREGCCCDKKDLDIQISENREKKLEQVQNMSHDKGTQTHLDLKVTKRRETEGQTEQGTQTELDIFYMGNIFYRTSGRDAKTTQTESEIWPESVDQERATPQKNKLSRTGNEVEASPILRIAACPCVSDVNRNPKQGRNVLKEARKTHKHTVHLPCISHVIPAESSQKDRVLDNDDRLSNQRNINWYLSLLINILISDPDCCSFNGKKC